MAIKTYKKDIATELSNNFKSTEFDCHGSNCCSVTLIDEALVDYLQAIRDHFGKAVNVSSAYRCNTHNKNVGGATGSLHKKGQAADIYIKGIEPAEIAKYAESIGVLGIGLYETDKDGHFVHIDTRTTKAFWYGQAQKPRSTFGGSSAAENKIDTSKINTSAANPQEMWNYFKSKGLNEYGIAGLMGNLYAESGLRPCNLQNSFEKDPKINMNDAEYTAAVDAGVYTNFVNDKAGYGLAQWTYWSLKQDMLNYFQKKNKSIGDLETQMEFLVYQLSNQYKAVWNILLTATSVREASDAVLMKFERPADQSVDVQKKRAAFGQKYYDSYASKKEDVKIEIPEEGGNGKMKYSDNNKPLVCMQTQSTCYKGTSKMNVKGVLWHSTGANNPWLKRYIQPSDNANDRDTWLELLGKNQYNNDWNHITRQAGLNCWIGKLADGTVTTVQTMPWDYKPWGCGSGPKGSCNNGWIQFEICEDGLNDKEYFEKVYQEACEITAYLCKMFNLDPNGVVNYNGVEVPVILCHADSHKLKVGSNHGDVNHWFPKFGKSMETVRADVAELLGKKDFGTVAPEAPAPSQPEPPIEAPKNNSKFQIGNVAKLKENATYASGKAIPQWVINSTVYVRDIRENGDIVFSTQLTGPVTGVTHDENLEICSQPAIDLTDNTTIKVGNEVKLLPNATYSNGNAIPKWVFSRKLYVRDIRSNGEIIISTLPTGAITGVVNKKYLVSFNTFMSYKVKVNVSVLNVREEASLQSKIVNQIRRNSVQTITNVEGKWGKCESGWIYLPHTLKL